MIRGANANTSECAPREDHSAPSTGKTSKAAAPVADGQRISQHREQVVVLGLDSVRGGNLYGRT